ncbi:hypothetical protein HYT51_00715 [Candidatus Woesearchaeota archaeon]|nr:hypothetical protein [Candidatus Woesearchaeota archaeon]
MYLEEILEKQGPKKWIPLYGLIGVRRDTLANSKDIPWTGYYRDKSGPIKYWSWAAYHAVIGGILAGEAYKLLNKFLE